MALTIDELNIELTANSKEVSSALDELKQTLERLKAALSPIANINIKVSNSLSNVTKNTDKTSNAIKRYTQKADKAGKSTQSLTQRLAQKISTTRTLASVFQNAANVMADWFNESNEYIETVNLFRVTMGDASDGAMEYAKSVSTAMGIDIAEWMQYQGTFKNLTAGFGVASESADIMSQNLTQLSYDMASFFNTDVEKAFDKLSSAMAGQVKGLREFGIDTTVASLQEYALSKGIDASVRSMSQAEKSLLRYNYIMEKATLIQGDMARTLLTPANSLRVLSAQLTQMKRALGNIVSVIVVQFIPYVQAMVQIITEAANAIAVFFGFSAKDFEADLSGLDTGGFAGGFEDAEESLEGVSGSISKIKKQLMGFDELNIISNPETGSGGASGGASGGGAGLNLEPLEYDFLANLDTSKVDEIKEKMKDILIIVGEIAIGLLAWKLSKSFLGSINALAASIGLVLTIDAVRTVLADGLDMGDIIKGAIGGALMGGAIGFKAGGFPGAIGGAFIGIGVILTILGITSMFSEGVDVENAVLTGIGLGFAGGTIGFKLGGVKGGLAGLTIGVGVSLIVTSIASMLDEGVNVANVVEMVTGVLTTVGGIIGAVKLFNSKHKAPSIEIETASQTIETVSTGTSNMTSKLTNLAKNLGLGLVILAEVAAAAVLFVGAIAVLGEELTWVKDAWEPVTENGGLVATAIGIGTGILVAVGVATAALGTGGVALAGQIGIGIAMLAELSIAADLFLAEIAIIGVLLTQINTAWTPVLLYGDPIAIAIGVGTGLLIAIGVVAAALGTAAVASAGALPIAIGLGTAMLVELGVAFVAFVDSLVNVAESLADDLAPALDEVNTYLPDMATNMSNFTKFMTAFAVEVVKYTTVSSIAGIAATVDKIIDFFTTDPVQRMSDEVEEQNEQFEDLISKLKDCLPDIAEATELVKQYNTDMETFNATAGNDKFSVLTFFADVVQGADDIQAAWETLKSWWDNLQLPEIDLQMPHFSWTYVEAEGTLAKVLKAVGLEPKYPKLNISWYAEGGFPDMGQLFIANEAGPELVGNIGRKTTVANNDQIIAGIEGGVYRAMRAANATKQGGTQTIRIINEIDGDVVGEKVIQYHNGKVLQTGVSPLLV